MLPMPDTQTDRQTSEYRATQLVSSIKFKLSHAIQKHRKTNGNQGVNYYIGPIASEIHKDKNTERQTETSK